MRRACTALALLGILACLGACGDGPWNNPHPPETGDKVTYYSVMAPAPPKHLDPAISYAADESLFIMQIYEPPMGYHFLKRPYTLIPQGATDFPVVEHLDARGEPVNGNSEAVRYTRYTLRVREDARYQPHPAFATDAGGDPVYVFDTARESEAYEQISDFTESGSRPVRAEDYVYAIKRLADPNAGSPMLG
ncbi:MAG: hypothetical protein RIC38_06435, partial [Chromatocurvus sp.]